MFSFDELYSCALHVGALLLAYYTALALRAATQHLLASAPAVAVARERRQHAARQPAASDRTQLPAVDPATGVALGEPLRAASAADVRAALARARAAQRAWRLSGFAARRRLLHTLLRFVTEHIDDVVEVACRDSGKTPVDALLGEVMTTCEKLRWVLAHGERHLQPEYRDSGLMNAHKTSRVEWVPVGVVGAIVPWNYPFHNVFNPLIAAVFAGNAIVIKTSEHASWSTRYYQRVIDACLAAAGAPPHLVQIVVGYGETGAALLSPPLADNDRPAALGDVSDAEVAQEAENRAGGPRERGVDLVIFVGSVHVGSIVARAAAASLTPVVLELGGKDPFIIMDDVDVASIIQLAARGVFQNAGQNCAGVERFLVYESVYDEFVDRMTKLVGSLKVGSPLDDPTVDVGALRMPNAAKELEERVAEAVRQGARLLVGGHALPPSEGQFLQPTLLVDVTDDMKIAQEEIFGPIMCVFKVRGNSDDEAVRIANHCSFALGSCVFSNDAARANAVGMRIRAGMCAIDDLEGTTYLSQSLPFGGPARSGGGRFAGIEGLRGMCYAKSVVQNRASFLKPSMPPPVAYPSQGHGAQFAHGLLQLLYGYDIGARVRGLVTLIKASMAKPLKRD